MLSMIAIVISSSCTRISQTEQASNDLLWYDHPAEDWEEALPLGNGRIGVMVYGKTSNERIHLNDDSMWPGDPGWNEPD